MLMLMAKGYRVMARRFRSPVGEIDLVMRRGRTLAFVEVKARASTGAAAEAITMRQRDRLVAACRAWLASNPRFAEYNIRFDAVLVAPYRLPRHMRDAFQARR